MREAVVSVAEVDSRFCRRLARSIRGVRLATYASEEGRTSSKASPRWAADDSYRNTFKSVLFDRQASGIHLPRELVEAARELTGYLDIMAFRAQVNVLFPGQSLGRHTDVPEFYGARRWSLPDWLLVTMVHSGLFDMDEVRVVDAIVWPVVTAAGNLRVFSRANDRLLIDHSPRLEGAVLFEGSRLPHEVGEVPGERVLVGPDDLLRLEGCTWTIDRLGDMPAATLPLTSLRTSVLLSLACFEDARGRNRYFSEACGQLREEAVIAELLEAAPKASLHDDVHQSLVDAYVSYM